MSLQLMAKHLVITFHLHGPNTISGYHQGVGPASCVTWMTATAGCDLVRGGGPRFGEIAGMDELWVMRDHCHQTRATPLISMMEMLEF